MNDLSIINQCSNFNAKKSNSKFGVAFFCIEIYIIYNQTIILKGKFIVYPASATPFSILQNPP